MFEKKGIVCPLILKNDLFTTGNLDNTDHNPSSTSSCDALHGTAISKGGQYRITFVPNYFCTELQYRITFSVPVPALHLVLSTSIDLELLLVLLNRYFLPVLLFCLVSLSES